VLTDTLNETAAGIHAFSREDVRKFLITAYSEFKTKGHVPYHGDAAAVGKYTYVQMARRFAEVLNLVSGRSIPEANATTERNGCVHYDGKEDAINQYTHVEMARKFAEILNNVVARHNHSPDGAAATIRATMDAEPIRQAFIHSPKGL
jgi:hypothetical protein